MVHVFEKSLAVSQNPLDDDRVEKIMRSHFYGAKDFKIDWTPRNRAFEHDFEVQAYGELYLWEDKRRPRDFGDELLELVSNTTTRRPGWTFSASRVDYVLHLYPLRWVFLPGAALEKAFKKHAMDWQQEYGTKTVENQGYQSVNVAVPTRVLRAALAECGAPICFSCRQNVGRFGSSCTVCGTRSCCAISDGEWICAKCAV